MACVNKSTGKPLSVYETKKEADESAKYSKKNFKIDLYAYKCENCGKYHLAPKDSKISVKHDACSCLDSNGKPKALYGSKKDAEKQMEKSSVEQHIKLRVYKCPDGKGYHLTHTLALEDRSEAEQAAVAAKKKAAKKAASKPAEKKPAAKKSSTAKKTTTSKKAPAKKTTTKTTVKKTTAKITAKKK